MSSRSSVTASTPRSSLKSLAYERRRAIILLALQQLQHVKEKMIQKSWEMKLQVGTGRVLVFCSMFLMTDRFQFAICNLSTAMSRPSTRKQKELEHLALYLKGTADYRITYKRMKPGTSALQQQPKTEEESEVERNPSSRSSAIQIGQETNKAGSLCNILHQWILLLQLQQNTEVNCTILSGS